MDNTTRSKYVAFQASVVVVSWLEAKHPSSLCKKTTGLPHSELQWKLNPWEFHDHFSCIDEAYSLNMLSRKNFVTNFFSTLVKLFQCKWVMTARISNLYGQLTQISYCIFISLPRVMGPEWLFQFWTPCYNKFWLFMTSSTGDEVFLIAETKMIIKFPQG